MSDDSAPPARQKRSRSRIEYGVPGIPPEFPGTVQAHVSELFSKGTLYDVKRLPKKGWFLHAPCTIHDLRETDNWITFIADGWDKKQFYILLSGVQQKPATVTIRPFAQATPGQAATDQTRIDFKPEQHLLTIALDGPSEVQLRFFEK